MSLVANKLMSLITSVTATVLRSLTKSEVIKLALPATVVTSDEIPATDAMFPTTPLAASVSMFDTLSVVPNAAISVDFPATVLTLVTAPATVLTLLTDPATVFRFVVLRLFSCVLSLVDNQVFSR